MTTPMSAERFADRFRYYRDQPQQQRGVVPPRPGLQRDS